MKSQRNYIALLVLVMLSTLRHSASVYLSICPTLFDTPVLNWAYAVGVVSVLDLVVIVFTIEGSKRLPVTYAVGLGILTGLYFLNVQLITDWVASTVFMVLVPLAGYEFAELFKQKRTAQDIAKNEGEAIQSVRDEIADIRSLLTDANETIKGLRQQIYEQEVRTDLLSDDLTEQIRTQQDTIGQDVETAIYERLRKKVERTMQKGGEA